MKAETFDNKLHAATKKVMDTHGFTGVTIGAIAQAAGISRVTLHRRGISKGELLKMAAMKAAGQFREASLAPLTYQGSGRVRLERLLAALFDMADQHLSLLVGLFDGPSALFHLGESEGDATALTRFEYTEPFARILRDGVNDGSLVSSNPDEDAELIFNTAGWTYVHFRRSHGWSSHRCRQAVARITLAFVLPPAPVIPK